MRASSWFARCTIAVVLTGVFVPRGSSVQQPGPRPRLRHVEINGVVLADGVRPTAGDTVLCALRRPGASANPRAVTDARGRFKMAIDSATATVPDQACIFQLWHQGKYRPLALKNRPHLLAVLFAFGCCGLPIDWVDTLMLKPD